MPRKKTDAEFRKEVFELVGDEYTVLDKYVDSQTKIRMKHNKCGNIWLVGPSHFLHKTRCPKCQAKQAQNQRRRTDAQFKKEVFDLVGDEYTVIDKYTNTNTALRIRHNKCGYIWSILPYRFLHNGKRCPRCRFKENGVKRRRTNKQFQQRVKALVGNEYTVLDKYINSNIKITIRHNKCGYVWKVKPHNFLRGTRCPQCSAKHAGKLHLKTNDQFQQEIKDLVGNEYTVLDKYTKGTVKIRMRHNKCGYVWKIKPDNFLSGTRCPQCSLIKRSKAETTTDEEFKQRVKQLVGDEYTVIGTYINRTTKIKMRHNKCNYTWDALPGNFLRGTRCPKCSLIKRSKAETITDEEFKQRIKNLVGDEYTVLDKYINAKTYVTMRHNKCGHIYKVMPYNFLTGSRCPLCAKYRFISTTDFKQAIKNMVGNEYTVLSDYVNITTKVKMKHNKCNYTWYVEPRCFLRGTRCPECASYKRACIKISSGEKLVHQALQQLKYFKHKDYIYGHVMKNHQHLDFYLPKLKVGIEYDGEQHLKPSNYFAKHHNMTANEYLDLIQQRDQRKNQYCAEHNIKLIRIPYTIKTPQAIFNILEKEIGYNK